LCDKLLDWYIILLLHTSTIESNSDLVLLFSPLKFCCFLFQKYYIFVIKNRRLASKCTEFKLGTNYFPKSILVPTLFLMPVKRQHKMELKTQCGQGLYEFWILIQQIINKIHFQEQERCDGKDAVFKKSPTKY
jgi:hypothetical protein